MNHSATNNSILKDLAEGFRVKKRIVFALYIREFMVRFGKYSLGFLWAFVEPIVHVSVLSAIFYAASRSAYDFQYPLFVMSGIMPWLLFKNVMIKSMNAMSANSNLYTIPNVKPIDGVLARAFFELNINLMVTFFLSIAFYFIGFDVLFDDFLIYIQAVMLLFLFALGLGLIFGVIAIYKDSITKIVSMTLRPMYFMSGIFYSVNIIPAAYRDIFLVNPVVNAIQLVRTGYHHSFYSPYVSLGYLGFCAILTLSVGLFYYNLNWKRILDE